MSISDRLDRSAAVRAAQPKLSGQPARLVEYLHEHGSGFTAQIAQALAIGNVSDAAAKANRVLLPLGFRITAQIPHPPIKNRFGEKSQMHQWFIARVR